MATALIGVAIWIVTIAAVELYKSLGGDTSSDAFGYVVGAILGIGLMIGLSGRNGGRSEAHTD